MNKVAKIGMAIWTILCFLGACSGMMNVANKTGGNLSDAEAVGTGIGLFVWIMIWFFPMAGMGIIALVTRPKSAPIASVPVEQITSLCPHCGKYFAGRASFCPFCGKPQELS
jgi:hypothetical protein